MWTYDGWADLSFMGGEVKNPQTHAPPGADPGALCVMLVYLVVNIGFMYLLPLPQMAQSKLIAATAAEHIPLFGSLVPPSLRRSWWFRPSAGSTAR